MSLTAGQTLLHYRIDAPAGEGGMGVVWKARDTRLGRDVAIKVLATEVADDPDRLARFEREARSLAALHHPHVASIFGFEEADGVRFLVMELVEGEDLAQRLERGAPAPAEALAIARQIAAGLEAAHEQGIVHRDLKPANVRITPAGEVKVLDFGLAKGARDGETGAVSGSDLSQSPTLAQAGTAAGLILGTASYMSPEQARGKPVDRRSDVWAFGVVLYEMLTGSRLFGGETVSDVLASVLKTEVDLAALPSGTPAAARRLLRRCLERDPKRRLRDMGDVGLEIEAALAGEDEAAAGAARTEPGRSGPAAVLPWLVAALALVALAGVWWLSPAPTATPAREALDLALPPPTDGQWLIGSNLGWGTISPDGRMVVTPAATPEGRGLWLRSLDGTEGRLLPRTEEGFYPFWSPDSRWIAFFNRGLLQRIEIDGGLPQRICVAPWGRGGSWSENGQILFTPVGGGEVHIVPAAGGTPRPVTSLNVDAGEDAHYWAQWLPGGEQFLYFIRSGRRDEQGVYLGRVLPDGPDTARRRVVASSSSGLFTRVGAERTPMLLWVEDDTLLARELDLAGGTVAGPTTRIAEGVRVLESQRGTMATASDIGTLVYSSAAFGTSRLAAFDRKGKGPEVLDLPTTAKLFQPMSSPDGRWLSYVVVEGGQGDVWVMDAETGQTRAITSSARYEEDPVWSPDSQELLIETGGSQGNEYTRLRLDGTVAPRPIMTDTGDGNRIVQFEAWLPGDWIIGQVPEQGGAHDLVVSQLVDMAITHELITAAGDQFGARVSTDGGALAYLSDEGGTPEGFLVSLIQRDGHPAAGSDRQRIPMEDASGLVWSRGGDGLYVVNTRNELYFLPVDRSGGRVRAGRPELLFGIPSLLDRDDFAVGRDGERFVFLIEPDAQHQTLPVLVNWPARLP